MKPYSPFDLPASRRSLWKSFLLLMAGLMALFPPTLFADLPELFDPAKHKDAETVEGAGFVIQPMPISSNYLIVTRPFENNPENKYLTFEAAMAPEASLGALAGTLVRIKAVRVKPQKKGEPEFRIISLVPIRKW